MRTMECPGGLACLDSAEVIDRERMKRRRKFDAEAKTSFGKRLLKSTEEVSWERKGL